jgi:hypothetical protein
MNDAVVTYYANHLKHLTSITLHGAFLVRDAACATLVEALSPQLRSFSIEHMPRIAGQTIKALTKCSQLVKLHIRRCDGLSDEDLRLLTQMETHGLLETLDLSYSGKSLCDDTIIAILHAIGSGLRTLELSGCDALTDQTLLEGIAACCPRLRELSLAECPGISDTGFQAMVAHWNETAAADKLAAKSSVWGLTRLDVHRNDQLGADSILGVVRYCNQQLRILNVSGLYLLDEGFFTELPKHCPRLEWLDVSWCRVVNDEHIIALYEHCPSLAAIKVWGCHKLTVFSTPRRAGVRLIGRECDTL